MIFCFKENDISAAQVYTHATCMVAQGENTLPYAREVGKNHYMLKFGPPPHGSVSYFDIKQ